MKLVQKSGKVHLGPFQAVRRIVLGFHGVGNVQGYHDFRTGVAALLELGSNLRAGKANHQKQPGQAETSQPDPALGLGSFRHKLVHKLRVSEAAEPAVSSPAPKGIEQVEERYREYE